MCQGKTKHEVNIFSVSKRSGVSNSTTNFIITNLAKQLEEEREARKKLEEELESIKQLSY